MGIQISFVTDSCSGCLHRLTDASRRVNSPLVIQFKPMTEALHLQSGSEDRSTKLQMTAGVEVYVRVFRLPLFSLIFTGIPSGLDKKGAYFF